MDLQKFIDNYLNKEDIKELTSEFDFKQTGSKKEIIERLIFDPDFEPEDITTVLYKEDVQDFCEDLDLGVSGTKGDLWDNFVDKLELDKKKAARVSKKPVSAKVVKVLTQLYK